MTAREEAAWTPNKRKNACNTADTPAPRRSCRKKKTVDYSEDVLAKNVDQEFVGKKGYTHFHRTRKGGDTAPNRVVDVN